MSTSHVCLRAPKHLLLLLYICMCVLYSSTQWKIAIAAPFNLRYGGTVPNFNVLSGGTPAQTTCTLTQTTNNKQQTTKAFTLNHCTLSQYMCTVNVVFYTIQSPDRIGPPHVNVTCVFTCTIFVFLLVYCTPARMSQTTNNKQQTTNNKQHTTHNTQQTTNNKQQIANNKQQQP